MCAYLKNMVEFTHNQLKNKSFDEVQKAFDKTMGWIDSFVPMDSEVVKDRVEGSENRVEDSTKRAGEKLEQEVAKKQKMEDDKEKEDLKQCFEIVQDDEVAIDVIPLATNQLLKEFDREDLENLWKLVKTKHENTRPEEGYERRLYDSSGIHFVRFEDIHVYMLVEKKYPLIPATITAMLNKKLQADYWNEMCYQLLKLMTKQLKNPGSVRKHPPVSAAGTKVTTAYSELMLLTELQLLKDYNC
ncbi:hypothetical protein Tco_0417741 [Tanacetum coccineum]